MIRINRKSILTNQWQLVINLWFALLATDGGVLCNHHHTRLICVQKSIWGQVQRCFSGNHGSTGDSLELGMSQVAAAKLCHRKLMRENRQFVVEAVVECLLTVHHVDWRRKLAKNRMEPFSKNGTRSRDMQGACIVSDGTRNISGNLLDCKFRCRQSDCVLPKHIGHWTVAPDIRLALMRFMLTFRKQIARQWRQQMRWMLRIIWCAWKKHLYRIMMVGDWPPHAGARVEQPPRLLCCEMILCAASAFHHILLAQNMRSTPHCGRSIPWILHTEIEFRCKYWWRDDSLSMRAHSGVLNDNNKVMCAPAAQQLSSIHNITTQAVLNSHFHCLYLWNANNVSACYWGVQPHRRQKPNSLKIMWWTRRQSGPKQTQCREIVNTVFTKLRSRAVCGRNFTPNISYCVFIWIILRK